MFSISTNSNLAAMIESLDGIGNNLRSNFGRAGLICCGWHQRPTRMGISSPAGTDLPSARAISQAVFAQQDGYDVLNDRDLSAFVYAWGQFLDHDLDLTPTGTVAFNITVPAGDPSFDPTGTGAAIIPLNRSITSPATGTDSENPAQQINLVTAFIDGSMVYGSDAERTAALRTFQDGQLKTSSGNLLPYNTDGLENENASRTPDHEMFLAGDVRANENVDLTALHTLFVREHNRQAAIFAEAHPTWTDEQLYQAARAIVIAEIQAITYNEFLPALLGDHALPRYRGYDPQTNPGIANEFSTAAYRFGHSAVGNDVEFFDNNGNEIAEELSFAEAFFNPSVVENFGIEPILKYLASDNMQEIDTKVVASLRDFLFGQPGQGGLDLAALNIQRGRDNGLASYNDTRVAIGLSAATSFADITQDTALQEALASVYESVDQVDLWVGGLAEPHLRGSSMGATFTTIIVDQFQRLRDGDRFFYLNQFSGRELRAIQTTSLAEIIAQNTTTINLQDNVFVFATAIRGRITAGQGRRTGEVANQTVNLLDAAGALVATTTTDANGNYRFDQTGLGTFTVEVPIQQDRSLTKDVVLTRGQVISSIDFELSLSLARPHRDRPGGPRSRR